MIALDTSVDPILLKSDFSESYDTEDKKIEYLNECAFDNRMCDALGPKKFHFFRKLIKDWDFTNEDLQKLAYSILEWRKSTAWEKRAND